MSNLDPVEIMEENVKVTVFKKNGDVYVSTEGDVHILKATHIFLECSKEKIK